MDVTERRPNVLPELPLPPPDQGARDVRPLQTAHKSALHIVQRIFSSVTRRELLGKHLKGCRRGGVLKSIGLNRRTERDLCVLIAGLDFGFGSEWSEIVDARDWRGNLLRLPRATAVSADKI